MCVLSLDNQQHRTTEQHVRRGVCVSVFPSKPREPLKHLGNLTKLNAYGKHEIL